MRKFFQFLFRKPVLWLSKKFDSKPDKERISTALTNLSNRIKEQSDKKGIVIPAAQYGGRFIIFSDQHKGARNGADDFKNAEPNYLAALHYYFENDFCFINLGDCEELWENTLLQVKKHNTDVFNAEKKFLIKKSFIKIFGNHDLYWANDPLAAIELDMLFGEKIKVYEGVIIDFKHGEKPLQIFCTHGHQGDARSDGNWLSKLFIARIWAPFQSYLRINTNEPSNDEYKKTVHNDIMYEWSAQQDNTILITGHTHQPVFESLTHIERLNRQWLQAREENDADTVSKIDQMVAPYRKRFDTIQLDYANYAPTYFNTGCCCFSDGDITGIEIEGDFIRLIKWKKTVNGSQRIILEEKPLQELAKKI
ncbi:MAG: metallophosphoesterase [Niabella sp.]